MEDQKHGKTDVPIQVILEELASKIDYSHPSKFNINRSNVLDGAFRGFRRKTYDPKNCISVRFSDDRGMNEEAVDLGGPRREFLRLLLESLARSRMFEGVDGHLNLALDCTAVREDQYFLAGRAISVCLVHGGPPPCFLSRTLFEAIAEDPQQCRPVLNDVVDCDLRQKIEQISESKTLSELQSAIEPMIDYLANAGCLHSIELTAKDQLVADILHFQVIQRVQGPFERFREGLRTLGVLQKLQMNPESFSGVLCHSKSDLTSEVMDRLFSVKLSTPGSNRMATESNVVAFWRDFLQDAEEESGESPTLHDILQFATGSNEVPPIGFSPQPSIEFLHEGGKYPIANTCVNFLRLPIHTNYDSFREAMDFGIRNTQGFGMA
ncbi:G2/M phase-specific E3 ubiquitin-protein ligase-like [Alosa pseudoharengus]|uniref:G2/M phase-specific E3 ubiquitin-protein ligase-like n=1 Tax=Alosa pseudoharengus TaxID=34774 RepID=UPI003F8A72A1